MCEGEREGVCARKRVRERVSTLGFDTFSPRVCLFFIFVVVLFFRLTRVHAFEFRLPLTNPPATGRVLILYGEVTGRVPAWYQSGRGAVTGRGMHYVKSLLSRKRVRSDRPLGGLSSGREVPSAPPENWLTINRRSQRYF